MKYIVLIVSLFSTFCAGAQSIRIPLHELEAGTQGQQIGVNSDGDQEYYTLIEGARDTIIVWNPLLFRFEYRAKSSLLSGYLSGSLTANTFPIATGATTLGNSQLVWNPTYSRFEFGGTAGLVFPNGTTAQRSSIPTSGEARWNTSVAGLDFYNGTRWAYVPESTVPRFTSTRIPFADANGQLTEDAEITFVNGTTLQTSSTGNIHGAVGRIASNSGRCDSPEGGIARVSGTGAIQITLPAGVFGGGGSLRQWAVSFEVVVTKYVGGSTQQQDKVVFVINGGNSPSIYQASAYSVGLGNNMQGLTWRVGHTGASGTVRVFLGELASSLGTNTVSIENIVFANNFGTSASIGELCNGWAVALQSSSFGTVSRSGLVTPQYGRVYALSTDGLLNLQRDVNAFHRARYQGNFNGAHEITLPPSTSNLSSLALPFQIKGGLVFGSLSNLYEFTIQGVYDYTSRNFSSCSVVWTNGKPADIPVRFGDDGTSGKIWIGALNPTDAASTAWTGSFLYIYDLVTYNCSQAAHQDFYANFPALQIETSAFNNIDVTIAASSSGSIPYVSTYGHTYDANFFRNSTQLKAGNYVFNIDQTVGAGQDGYALRWNNSTGEFEASADGTDTNFANTDLTFTGNRSHDAAGYTTTIENSSTWTLEGTGSRNFRNTGGAAITNFIRNTGANVVAGDVISQFQFQGVRTGSEATFGRIEVSAAQNNTRDGIMDFLVARASNAAAPSLRLYADESTYGEVKPVIIGHAVSSYPSTYDISAQVVVNGRSGIDLFAAELNGDTKFLVTEDGGVQANDYGDNNKTADDLSVTRSGLVTAPATDGTLYETGGILFTQTTIDTVNNTASETSLINTGKGSVTLPADYLEAGRTIICRGSGWWSNDNVTPSLNFRQYIGATEVGETAATSMPDLAAGQEFWAYETEMTCQEAGASGKVMTQGKWEWFYTDFTDGRRLTFSNTATATINTTTSQTLDFTVQMGSAVANAFVVMTNFYCYAKN